MNFKFNYLLVLAFFALISFNSCQDEILEVTPTDEETLIAPNSTLANLIQYTVTNDGSVDNIMDDSNCFSVNLPVTIIVNDITVTINTLEDLALIEDIFNEFDSDDDILEFLFPITIILNDYEEIVIENENQLEAFIEACVDNEDDVIECVDFHYPISFSIYNTEFQVIDTVVIESDEQLYEFLENLQNENDQVVLASLNFPVTMVYTNGNTVEVHNNAELEAVIHDAEEACDDDNEEDDCTKEHVDAYLTECHWNIVNFNGDDNFIHNDIYFNTNGTLEIINSETNETATGNWSTSMSDLGVVLTLSELTMFDGDLGGDWYVYECDDDRIKFTREPGTIEAYIIIERECNNETDCSVAEIQADLKECKWYLGTDLVDGNGPLMFTENGVALNGNVIGGWSLSLVEGHIYLTLDLSGDYMNISKEWKLVECDDDRLQFISGDYTLVLEQECDNSNPFECYSSLEYGICDDGDVYDGITTFNLNEIYPNCNEDNVEVSFHATENEAHNNVNPLTTTYTNTNNQETIFVRVTLAGTNEYEIFVVLLYVEDCSTSACTEEVLDSYLMEFECYWVAVSVDGSNAFDDYAIQFNENQDVLIEGNGSNVFGTWSTAGNPTNGVFLTITQLENNFSVINGQWLVTECGPERIVLVDGDHEMIIERVCP
jgi:hypothetical protein